MAPIYNAKTVALGFTRPVTKDNAPTANPAMAKVFQTVEAPPFQPRK